MTLTTTEDTEPYCHQNISVVSKNVEKVHKIVLVIVKLNLRDVANTQKISMAVYCPSSFFLEKVIFA